MSSLFCRSPDHLPSNPQSRVFTATNACVTCLLFVFGACVLYFKSIFVLLKHNCVFGSECWQNFDDLSCNQLVLFMNMFGPLPRKWRKFGQTNQSVMTCDLFNCEYMIRIIILRNVIFIITHFEVKLASV